MATLISARSASDGLAFGPAVVASVIDIPDDLVTDATFLDVARRTAERLEALATETRADGREEEAEVLEAYALMATDPALARDVAKEVDAGSPMIRAIRTAIGRLSDTFAAMEDEYFSQRADDVRGVGRELESTVAGTAAGRLTFPTGAIICAEDLTPADTVRLDLDRVGGFATERGGPTSHTAIVARSAGIPAVVGATGLLDGLRDGTVVLVDGDRGEVIIGPDEQHVRDIELRMGLAKELQVTQRAYHGRRTEFDGHRILVAANVGSDTEIVAASEAAADGVGLFRSEFLFLERSHAPERDEQHAVYRQAVEAFDDPTVVRTLDIGGDKEVPYLDLPAEDNPFLGVRGLRLCLAHPELFDVQLDALLAIDDPDRLRIMFPMVSSVADLLAGSQRLAERAALLGVAVPPTGVMIETPSAALLAGHLARHAAFFSIGTNDLTQYVTASDRTHGALGGYQDAANPAVLQLVDRTCRAGEANGIPTAVCGEAASDPVTLTVFLGLGVDELSIASTRIDRVRWLIDQLDAVAVRRVAREALELPDADAVRELVTPLLP